MLIDHACVWVYFKNNFINMLSFFPFLILHVFSISLCSATLFHELIGSFQAGITTTLNSRCAVLAAANSVFGRWDESKAEANIDFMPTILSRFDMIFIVKDEHDEKRDSVSFLLVFKPSIHSKCVYYFPC